MISSSHSYLLCRLQTHGCQEPYVIATNRQLSAQHPLHRLLHPHLRYTMQINAQARGTLVNCSGLIEKNFFGGKCVGQMLDTVCLAVCALAAPPGSACAMLVLCALLMLTLQLLWITQCFAAST